jgi:hypothetical protein
MPLEGGTPEKLDLAIEGLTVAGWENLRRHPDGRRIAFAAGETKDELWVMENFLPAAPAGQSNRPNH